MVLIVGFLVGEDNLSLMFKSFTSFINMVVDFLLRTSIVSGCYVSNSCLYWDA
jgi:hypothetical protein